MSHQKFEGNYYGSSSFRTQSIEGLYKEHTKELPSYYKIKNIACAELEPTFKQLFFEEIEDFMILDCNKSSNNQRFYTLCYVLKNQIFVIFDERSNQVNILYHTTKNEILKTVVGWCQQAKTITH